MKAKVLLCGILTGSASSQALGLTDERACTLPVEVFDESGKDYSANFKVRVQGGQVVLSNAKSFGIHIFLR